MPRHLVSASIYPFIWSGNSVLKQMTPSYPFGWHNLKWRQFSELPSPMRDGQKQIMERRFKKNSPLQLPVFCKPQGSCRHSVCIWPLSASAEKIKRLSSSTLPNWKKRVESAWNCLSFDSDTWIRNSGIAIKRQRVFFFCCINMLLGVCIIAFSK